MSCREETLNCFQPIIGKENPRVSKAQWTALAQNGSQKSMTEKFFIPKNL